MAFAVKVLGGILGGGTAAVGGCGVYSTVTGKPVLFFKGSEKASPQSGDQQTVTDQPASGAQDSSVPDAQTEQQKFQDLLTKVKNGCEIKVKEENSSTLRDISSESEQNLDKLLAALEGIKSDCGTEVKASGSKKEKVLKNESGTWSIVPEKELLKSLGETLKEKCVVKVRVASGSTVTYKPVTEDLGNTFENALYEAVKKLSAPEADCKNNTGSAKEIIFHKSNGSQWTKMEEKDLIKDLVGKTEFKCTVKIKTDGNTQPQELDSVDNQKLLGLLAKLETFKSEKCGSEVKGATNKDLVMQKSTSDSSWDIYLTDKQKIEEIVNDSTRKCSLKIRPQGSSDATQDKNFKDSTFPEGTDFSGLLTQITTECPTTPTEDKNLIYQLETGNKTWKKITDPASSG